MEMGFAQGLLFPLIILLIEYLVIQPWLRYREAKFSVSSHIDIGSNGRKWGDGIKIAIKQFKDHFDNYNWGGFSIKQHFVEISDFSINKGQAEIFLIVNVRYLLDKQRMVGQYRIVTDRIGDINQLETISLRKNPFDGQEIQFPGSWLIVGVLALSIMMFRFISLPQQPQKLVTDGNYYNTPVSQLWTQAVPLASNSNTNGAIGSNETDIYNFKIDLGGTLTVEIIPIDNFYCYLSIYNQNNSLIRRVPTYGRKTSFNIAPEPNANYLIIIEPDGSGGSYKLNLSLSP